VSEVTYAFLKVTFNDCEFARVDSVLHNEPTQRLLILAVHLARLDQLRAQLRDAVRVLLGVEVDDDCVYHDCVLVGRYKFLVDVVMSLGEDILGCMFVIKA
jgi:hypothetical protein